MGLGNYLRMIREMSNWLKGRRKIKDELGHSITYLGGYRRSLTYFLEVLGKRDDVEYVTMRQTIGWEPQVKFSWTKPRSFSPEEVADWVEKANLLSDNWNYFESRWQIYSGRNQEQHYFDIDIYHTTFPMGSREIGKLKHKITLDYLLTKK